MTRLIGITDSAPDDWKLTELGWIFSIAIFFLGVSSAVLLAMLVALLSVWLTFLFRKEPGLKLRKIGSVALMAIAMLAMHYTGMASATFMRV